MSFTARVVLGTLARPARRIRYGREHPDQRAELWLPGDGPPAPHPVCVVLHGGWWQARRTRTLLYTRLISRDLARRGWAALNVEYRRLGDGGGWPATFDDALAAVDAVAGLAGLDRSRTVVLGHSAGGHLALYAAAERDVAGVVALAAPSDLEAANDRVAQELVGGTPADVPDRYAVCSPVRRLPLNVPTLLIHGTRDDVVPVRRSRDYAAKARAAGDPDVTLVEPDCDHRAPADPRSREWAAVVAWLASRYSS